MTRLDDFVANVAKSGLILPHDLARARANSIPSPMPTAMSGWHAAWSSRAA